MPNALTHSVITRAALALQPFDTGCCDALISDYCNYPDRYSAADYDLPTDDIQFHYLPDSSLNELYRFWKCKDGKLEHCRNFTNENFYHAVSGFSRYLDLTFSNFRNGNREEALKYLGWILHVLEDATFGLHSLEGCLGSDPFILDRLSGKPVSDMLVEIQLDKMPELPVYSPRALGDSCAETVMRLYAEYCRVSADSRQCCFRYAISKLYGTGDVEKEKKQMFDNAVKLCADTVYTVFMLASGKTLRTGDTIMLTSFEPYEFPFGGCNGYRYRQYSIDHALDNASHPIPLRLGEKEYARGIAFAAHHAGALRYIINEEIFRKFTCRIGLHPGGSTEKQVGISIINRGTVVETFTLDKHNDIYDLTIDAPGGEFGFVYRCPPAAGEVVVIAEPQLFYR